MEIADDRLADPSRADDADRAGRDIPPHLSGQGIILNGGALHYLGHLAKGHHHEHDGVIGDGVGGIAAVAQAHAQALYRLQRYMVIADAAADKIFDPHFGKPFDILRLDVGGAYAGRLAPLGKAEVIRVYRAAAQSWH